jgi:hypothetical protein
MILHARAVPNGSQLALIGAQRISAASTESKHGRMISHKSSRSVSSTWTICTMKGSETFGNLEAMPLLWWGSRVVCDKPYSERI